MADNRTRFSRDVSELIRNTYGGYPSVFKTVIPRSVKAAEASAEGESVFLHDAGGKVAESYMSLTMEVMSIGEKQRRQNRTECVR